MSQEAEDRPENRPGDRPAWAWIDLDALAHNARRALECAEGRSVIGVVKADAYGHGAERIAKGLLAAGITRLAVVSVGEGAALRRAGLVTPILLMGELGEAASIQEAMKWNLTPVVHDRQGFEQLRSVGRASAPLAVEVEVDTGMHRMGVSPAAEATALIRGIAETPGLSLSGLYTHLACADEVDPGSAQRQTRAFREIVAAAGPAVGSAALHVVNSAGLLRRAEIEDAAPGLTTRAVRPGLMLYGVSPFPDQSAASLGLRPVMSLAARIVATRDVAEGEGVGYGAQWSAPAGGARIATVPLGYADGLPRALADPRSGPAEVVVAGQAVPIVGRVSMDYVTLDVSGVPEAVAGAVVTVFGATAAGEAVPVEPLAAAAGTIGYELLTGVGARVPRFAGQGPPPTQDPRSPDRAV